MNLLSRGRAAVVVVSTQAAADPALDRTGPVIAAWLREHDFAVPEPVIVADGGPVAETVTSELLAEARVVITTGGTGVTPTDRTPEAVAPLLDLQLPGIVEEIRRRGLQRRVRPHCSSRGVAGIAGGASSSRCPGPEAECPTGSTSSTDSSSTCSPSCTARATRPGARRDRGRRCGRPGRRPRGSSPTSSTG